MRKQIIWIVACLVLAFWGDRIIGYFFKKMTAESQFRYSKLYNSTDAADAADILLVGNSRGLTFYQPEVERLTQQKTTNLSYNGMPADLAKCLVADYLDRHAPPKIMVVDVTMCDRDNDALKAGFNLYTPNSPRLDTLLRGMTTGGDAWAGRKIVYGGAVSRLFRYNSEIFQRVLYHRNKPDNDWIVDRTISESAATDTAFLSYKVRYFPNQIAHLKDMIAFAQSKGVDVRLVINPYFPPFAATIRDSFLTPLTAAVESATGLKIEDFSTALTERDEIGDYQHANKKGAIHYMNILFEKGIFVANTTARSTGENPLNQVNLTENPPIFTSEKAKVNVRPQATTVHFEKTDPSVFDAKKEESKQIVEKKRPRKTRRSDFGFAVDTVGWR